MGGEAQYYSELISVIGQVVRQSLLSDGSQYSYSWFELDKKISKSDQVTMLMQLSKKKLIAFKHEKIDHDGLLLDSYMLTANLSALKAYEDEVASKLGQLKSSDENEMHVSSLRLDDIYLKLRIDSNEYTIGRLQEDLKPHKIFVLLSNRTPGLKVNRNEVGSSSTKLWQIIEKSRFGYLKPFFKTYSDGGISYKPHVELSNKEIQRIYPQISAKYRKSINSLV